MVLLVDVGNSNIVFGFVENDKFINTFRSKTLLDVTTDDYYLIIKSMLDNYTIDEVIISSVVPVVTSVLKKLFVKYLSKEPLIVGPGVKTGIEPKCDDPKTVGADMICDCAGAMIDNNEALIIDLGTATKYIYCKNNKFLGCSIAPGVSISMKALVNNAALLPSVELQTPKTVIGTNTITCMQSGVIYGAASQVDGMIDRIIEELKNPNIKIIATGGLSKLIIPLCKHEITRVENLTLYGLNEIYKKNKMVSK